MKRTIGRLSGSAGRVAPCADILFTDDATISALAARYRRSPGPTDVLAFEYGPDQALMGEVAVSIDTARRQAKERGVPLSDELALLCVHGLLHLRGFDDEEMDGWCAMRMMEFELLASALAGEG